MAIDVEFKVLKIVGGMEVRNQKRFLKAKSIST